MKKNGGISKQVRIQAEREWYRDKRVGKGMQTAQEGDRHKRNHTTVNEWEAKTKSVSKRGSRQRCAERPKTQRQQTGGEQDTEKATKSNVSRRPTQAESAGGEDEQQGQREGEATKLGKSNDALELIMYPQPPSCPIVRIRPSRPSAQAAAGHQHWGGGG